MPGFDALLQQGSAHAWLFIPSAILLGALHGLEPGHSKTMMAAFIVAVRGTVLQAALLGLAATLSHTAVVWGIALAGMTLWQGLDAEAIEPYFQLASGLAIIAIALWMVWRVRRDHQLGREAAGHGHSHAHHHGDHRHHHPHSHGHDHVHSVPAPDVRRIDTGYGAVALELHEGDGRAVWRLRTESGPRWSAYDVKLTTERPDGALRVFVFTERGDFLQSVDAVEEPHEFMARLTLRHGGHSHAYDLAFLEPEGDDRLHAEMRGLARATDGYQDAHELAHANDVRKRFADGRATTGQIVLFGLTGGLIPCPAAITVLLLCLQLKEFSLGFTLVLCFSIGLALTLVSVGALAALSIRQAGKRWSGFSTIAARAPYLSSLLILAVGIYTCLHGWQGIALAGP
ncbi:nickel/cobalt efflux transporter [Rhizobium sp. FKL33]|uniref:nickel/cobalt efflux transporter n=1 Tax=Rhizobium sp. FKL33 TaxID=2562307 RepID=UPI0010C0EAC4|nr:nickel/cobalt efflux transporter [Rhizobium sp. FKL33]